MSPWEWIIEEILDFGVRTRKLCKNVITEPLISRQLFSVGVRNSICTCTGLLPCASLHPLQFDCCHILGVLLAQPRGHTRSGWLRSHHCTHHDNLDGFNQCGFAKNLLCKVPWCLPRLLFLYGLRFSYRLVINLYERI